MSLGAFDEPTAFEARSGPHVAAAFYPTAMRASGTSRLRVARVHFSPGARTAWHQHPFGQILHVLHGRGRVQQRGHPVEDFQAGDTIVTLPGEWHCHGAAPGTFMTHLAIQEADDDCKDVYWGEKVTDEEYHDTHDR